MTDEITWQMLSDAGIDIDLVELVPSGLGGEEFILVSGDLKIAFGPAHDAAGNSAEGWDICAYQRKVDDDGVYWDDFRQDYVASAVQAVATVKAVAGI
jgi:hypothetical protein